MVKLKAPLLSLSAIGRLAKHLSFSRRHSDNVVVVSPTHIDPHSPTQLFNRHMFSKCSALWLTLSSLEKQEWESLARSRHMPGRAYFISQCLRPNPGIYLPLQGGTMSGDIAMASNRIKTLPAPAFDKDPLIKGTPITLAELPPLTHDKIWLGDVANRPTEQSLPPKVAYIELDGSINTTAQALGAGDGVWVVWDLSATLPAGTISADIHVRKLTATDLIGVRKDSSLLVRTQTVLKNDAFLFPSQITATRKIEIMSADVSDADIFYLTGYWS